MHHQSVRCDCLTLLLLGNWDARYALVVKRRIKSTCYGIVTESFSLSDVVLKLKRAQCMMVADLKVHAHNIGKNLPICALIIAQSRTSLFLNSTHLRATLHTSGDCWCTCLWTCTYWSRQSASYAQRNWLFVCISTTACCRYVFNMDSRG